MNIILSPEKGTSRQLTRLYEEAFQTACEIYIASAYLTDWNTRQKLPATCERIVFVVGTDDDGLDIVRDTCATATADYALPRRFTPRLPPC